MGFGCASLMRVTSHKGRDRLLATAFDSGITHFDVARMYGLGAAEGELGRFAKGRRDRITIATKFGIEASSGVGALQRLQAPARALLNAVPPVRRFIKRRDSDFHAPRDYSLATARRSLEQSLLELGTDYVDLFFVHDPTPADPIDPAALHGLFTELRDEGKIRAWGVSQDAYPELSVNDGLGADSVLQIRSDIFNPAGGDQARISFGVLGATLARIQRELNADSSRWVEWERAFGGGILKGDRLSHLLLSDAFAANPDGTVLFSTIRPERVASACLAVTEPASADELNVLHRLALGLPEPEAAGR